MPYGFFYVSKFRRLTASALLRLLSRIASLPASVRGPVLRPPWNLHRRLPGIGLHWQGVPLRVLAPQRSTFPSFLRPRSRRRTSPWWRRVMARSIHAGEGRSPQSDLSRLFSSQRSRSSLSRASCCSKSAETSFQSSIRSALTGFFRIITTNYRHFSPDPMPRARAALPENTEQIQPVCPSEGFVDPSFPDTPACYTLADRDGSGVASPCRALRQKVMCIARRIRRALSRA